MRSVLAMVKKELLEIAGDPYARRGGIIQAVIMTAVLGVLIPSSAYPLWQAASPLAITYFAFLPGVSAASVAADTIAGERERRTLETLLATPLTEATILAGKVLAAVLWGFLIASVSLVVGTVVVNFAGGATVPAPVMVLGALGASLASGGLMASMAVVVSTFIPAARPAQQVSSLAAAGISGASLAAWKALGLAMTWTNVFLAEGAVVVLAFVVLEVARARFRRDRFFRSA
jgi:ABC-2 type transport system permease protein